MSLNFDPTISLGQVITLVAFLLGGIAAYGRLAARTAVIESRVNDLWSRFIKGNPGTDGEGEAEL